MVRLFFLLSGEHKTLPFAELKAILDTGKIVYEELQTLPQVLRLDTQVGAVEIIERKAALTRVCCQELFCCHASSKQIMGSAQSTCLDNLLRPQESFAVRIRRVGDAARNLASMDLERKIGKLILGKANRAIVDLEQPQKPFFGVITENSFVFGLKLAEISPAPFTRRRPKKRAFFHPSAMPAKLARCMVNLVQPRSGDLLLDPFCGTGSFLIEAGLIGCRVLGFDAKKSMVKGALKNLKFFNVGYEGVAAADAKHLPLTRADCIVTDPPYGRSASTMGYSTEQVIKDFLQMSVGTMAKQQRICIAAPKTIHIRKIAEALGFAHVQSHFVYVHRSLTREIAVLEKP
ncbi:MAG: N-6 DNA methylase [Candidatus Bathyarchaeota archaeon]|nr:MAG: N-6 DNA methylase [Candidatus Bathyarchaeota archaeon]